MPSTIARASEDGRPRLFVRTGKILDQIPLLIRQPPPTSKPRSTLRDCSQAATTVHARRSCPRNAVPGGGPEPGPAMRKRRLRPLSPATLVDSYLGAGPASQAIGHARITFRMMTVRSAWRSSFELHVAKNGCREQSSPASKCAKFEQHSYIRRLERRGDKGVVDLSVTNDTTNHRSRTSLFVQVAEL